MSEGHDAHHVSDLGIATIPDRAIWMRAREMGACIITKDEDFVLMQALDGGGPAIVWIRTGNAARRVLPQRLAIL